MKGLDGITFILFLVMLVVSAQYNYFIFSLIALGIFFVFEHSWLDLILLIVYFSTFVFFNGNIGFGIITSIILLLIFLISRIFMKKGSSSESDSLDFSKLFGGGDA